MWSHEDNVGIRGVDLSNEQYQCQVCKWKVENMEDVAIKQQVIVKRHQEIVKELKNELPTSFPVTTEK